MKSLTKLASAILLLAMVFAAFPAMGVSNAHAATCDWAQFMIDVTVPDGTTIRAGHIVSEDMAIEKHWQLYVDHFVCAGVQQR